jgi:pimeloyl-ACP methyl ester carboxylesterase
MMTDTAPPLGRLYAVDGRRLMLHRTGDGDPTVVFLPGAGLVGLDFLNLQQRAAEFATSVLYDRGGTGWSDPADLPRTPGEVVEELRRLLQTAGLPGPYVLVAHSLGTFYARRYAQLWPADVAGLLFLDPGHEDILSFLPDEAAEFNERMKPDLDNLPDLTDEQIQASRTALTRLFAEWPDAVREALIERKLATWRTAVYETLNFETDVYDEGRAGGPLPDVPLVVATAMATNPLWAQFAPEDLIRRTQEGIRTMHAAIAKSVPRGRHLVLDEAFHQAMHIQEPGPITDALHTIVDQAQTHPQPTHHTD